MSKEIEKILDIKKIKILWKSNEENYRNYKQIWKYNILDYKDKEVANKKYNWKKNIHIL